MIDDVLKMLKEKEDFISGEEMGKKLNLSRNSICKYIAKIRGMGYDIQSVTNRGYKLKKDDFIFNEIELRQSIDTKILGKEIYFFEDLSSTNEYAKTIANDVKEGAIVLCNNQTNGKGRLDRAWRGSKGKNVYLSLILKPDIELINVWQITLLSGIALCNTLSEITESKSYIKWPNDIILNDKKVSGILTEVNAQIDKVGYIILGIGINVNEDNFNDEILKKATSLFLETKKQIDRKKVVALFLSKFEYIYTSYLKEKDFKSFLKEYKKMCINMGRDVKIFTNGKEIIGRILDISDFGHLIVETNDKKIEVVSGDVSIRGIDGEYI